MEYIKHWVVGDQTYGTPGKSDNLGLRRQFLHSYFIEFNHPRIDDELSFMAPLPDDLVNALSRLKDRRIGLTERGREVLFSYQQNCGITDEVETFACL
jgi:23S rRNA pseudouridine1911/1915/1917 synthase